MRRKQLWFKLVIYLMLIAIVFSTVLYAVEALLL
ncbi:stressosome-associated protein Prli42 [Gordoniibacillus kamchatkensis]|nr:stressosome-associated protein Prli42 [Paenibacillus sp. VKM B-2647]